MAPDLDLALRCAVAYLNANRPEWHARAACKGQPEPFFPARGASTEPARELCRVCPVLEECSAFAASIGTTLRGIWAGRSERERRQARSRVQSPRACVVN